MLQTFCWVTSLQYYFNITKPSQIVNSSQLRTQMTFVASNGVLHNRWSFPRDSWRFNKFLSERLNEYISSKHFRLLCNRPIFFSNHKKLRWLSKPYIVLLLIFIFLSIFFLFFTFFPFLLLPLHSVIVSVKISKKKNKQSIN